MRHIKLYETYTDDAKRTHPVYKKIEDFLKQFPDNATSWADATDEVRDFARTAKEYYNELDLDLLVDDPKGLYPLDFRSIKTPAEWNKKGRDYIFNTVDMMSDKTKNAYMVFVSQYHVDESLNTNNKLYHKNDVDDNTL